MKIINVKWGNSSS